MLSVWSGPKFCCVGMGKGSFCKTITRINMDHNKSETIKLSSKWLVAARLG